jgi:hypothetical protein
VTATEAKSAEKPTAPPITAAVVLDVNMLKKVQSVAITSMYVLLGLVVLIVVVRVSYTRISEFESSEREFRNLMREAEELVRSDRHSEAYSRYNNARKLYMQLKPTKKVKHYDKLMALYISLSQHKKMREAHYLADKYIAGTITKEELEKFRELIS